MFVQDAYDKRVKKQQQENINTLHPKKTKAPKIGSIKNDKINYDAQQQFFSKDDIPNHAKTIKQEVKKFIDPDHLGLRKRQWNPSISVPKNMESEQTHEQRLLKIKLGFMDHPLPKYKQPVIYQGVDFRNDYTNWNVSNQVISKQVNQNYFKQTSSAFENSKIRQVQFLSNYLNPFGRTVAYIESLKKEKVDQESYREQLRKQYIFDNPTASEEKINAAIFRMTYEGLVKEKKDNFEAQAMKTDFKASLTQTQIQKMKVVSNHTGIWQKFSRKVGQNIEEEWAWSCCMNEQYNNSGCVKKIKDGNKWNFSSFNNA